VPTGHLELDVTAVAAGGDGIAREPSGRIVFVAGAVPGDRVRATLTEERRDYARGHLDEVIVRGASRVDPPCPFVSAGCGGCDWMHVDPSAQRDLKVAITVDALTRIGRVADPHVEPGRELPALGYRTTVRGVALDGRFALRRRHSHDLVAIDPCLVAHPLLAECIADGRFPDGSDVVLRCGARTGDRLAVVAPTAAEARVPAGTALIGADDLRAGRRAWIHEEAAGRRWRVSARSFFQARADGADALVETVRDAAADVLGGGRHLLDLYAGVGLFAGALGEDMAVTAVERSASAVADARVNLADRRVRLLRLGVDRWRPSPADVVVADPPREGLGAAGVAKVVATGARRLVLVSCDPAALGRDARLLESSGYRHAGATLVDLFPHTSHVEVVSRFDRSRTGGAQARRRA
jgi:23S rRNA (uracil1939-C5)-methyltransferase